MFKIEFDVEERVLSTGLCEKCHNAIEEITHDCCGCSFVNDILALIWPLVVSFLGMKGQL